MVKKVKNAPKKLSYDGIVFDSSLEIYCYKALKAAGLEFEYTPTSFVLVPGFTFSGTSYESDKRIGKLLSPKSSKMQSIKYTPDFVGSNWIIETKGVQTDVFTMRFKLFKKYLTENNMDYDLYMPKNHNQVDQTITLILEKND